MASVTEICNRALQHLGAKRISSLSEDSTNARACNTAYEAVRDAELRKHPWSFAIDRASLAASATAPAFGRANSFQLPSDFIRLLPPYPEDNKNSRDWQIEGTKIYSDEDAPLKVRYIKREEDPNVMDPLFREALSAALAVSLAEALTQSNTKKQVAAGIYSEIIGDARKVNAFERVAQAPPEDSFVTVRESGVVYTGQ